jgi:hypothetical protein
MVQFFPWKTVNIMDFILKYPPSQNLPAQQYAQTNTVLKHHLMLSTTTNELVLYDIAAYILAHPMHHWFKSSALHFEISWTLKMARTKK